MGSRDDIRCAINFLWRSGALYVLWRFDHDGSANDRNGSAHDHELWHAADSGALYVLWRFDHDGCANDHDGSAHDHELWHAADGSANDHNGSAHDHHGSTCRGHQLQHAASLLLRRFTRLKT